MTRRLNCLLREVVVLEPGLLQANDIGLLRGKPFQQLWQENLERVDVPCRQFHLAKVPDGLAP